MVMLPHVDNYCDYAGRAFDNAFSSANMTVAAWKKPVTVPNREQLGSILREIRKLARGM